MNLKIHRENIDGKEELVLIVKGIETADEATMAQTIIDEAKEDDILFCSFPWLEGSDVTPVMLKQLIKIANAEIIVLLPDDVIAKMRPNYREKKLFQITLPMGSIKKTEK